MKIAFYLLVLGTFILIIIAGCDDTATGIDNTIIPYSNVSFAKYIEPVFQAKCANSGCHDPETAAGGYDLSSWVGITNPRLIVKGDTSNSPLVWAIKRLPSVSGMPPYGYPALTANQIYGIDAWIEEGAKNN